MRSIFRRTSEPIFFVRHVIDGRAKGPFVVYGFRARDEQLKSMQFQRLVAQRLGKKSSCQPVLWLIEEKSEDSGWKVAR